MHEIRIIAIDDPVSCTFCQSACLAANYSFSVITHSLDVVTSMWFLLLLISVENIQ